MIQTKGKLPGKKYVTDLLDTTEVMPRAIAYMAVMVSHHFTLPSACF
jgi:hypothetical protein